MKGRVVNYRGSHKTQNPKQMIVKVNGVDSKKKAKKLIGKEVIWQAPSGKKIKGEISAAHGNKGAVRAIFTEKGLPGQALSDEVEIS